jgi:hypothetical protein
MPLDHAASRGRQRTDVMISIVISSKNIFAEKIGDIISVFLFKMLLVQAKPIIITSVLKKNVIFLLQTGENRKKLTPGAP